MIINATRENIQKALNEANKEFGGNLQFKRLDPLSNKRYRVTLRVCSSRGKGARLGFPSYSTGKQRHLISACWHAHGTFFDALPEGTRIQAGEIVTYPGEPWQDRNIGSLLNPLYFSEACEC